MTELDYAFVAEFAKVDEGKLTVVGASYLEVRVPHFPYHHVVAVAGRIRSNRDAEPFPFKVSFNAPGTEAELVIEGTIDPAGSPQLYGDKAGILFSVTNTVLLTGPGLCEIFIYIDGEQVRRLAFDVLPEAV
ncbi:hypothetical protein KKP62_01540 [Rhodococcus sp. GOMB7]|uniref:DUF6941 family protein n=1 Tax=Rhodococcus sp. GOMB7 TaxID=2839033 RepID=UPI001BFFEB72|nr:hypothetical protein [Rhodococcus sp. GOMB7]MBT9293648.1 hypothetical protein [Rhodococcus sp. GOMB7]